MCARQKAAFERSARAEGCSERFGGSSERATSRVWSKNCYAN